MELTGNKITLGQYLQMGSRLNRIIYGENFQKEPRSKRPKVKRIIKEINETDIEKYLKKKTAQQKKLLRKIKKALKKYNHEK